ncbi:hypothetical protein Slin15195_G129550 [Septoria linicola]|uniref:Uncharacterized protein n=1 Tax=Septoria linicola TaxID=215465 RepID=A0A9Q9BB10_9PEZI|nr:hypothetical protein Slin15195_G129550 [Septoria linicola]
MSSSSSTFVDLFIDSKLIPLPFANRLDQSNFFFLAAVFGAADETVRRGEIASLEILTNENEDPKAWLRLLNIHWFKSLLDKCFGSQNSASSLAARPVITWSSFLEPKLQERALCQAALGVFHTSYKRVAPGTSKETQQKETAFKAFKQSWEKTKTHAQTEQPPHPSGGPHHAQIPGAFPQTPRRPDGGRRNSPVSDSVDLTGKHKPVWKLRHDPVLQPFPSSPVDLSPEESTQGRGCQNSQAPGGHHHTGKKQTASRDVALRSSFPAGIHQLAGRSTPAQGHVRQSEGQKMAQQDTSPQPLNYSQINRSFDKSTQAEDHQMEASTYPKLPTALVDNNLEPNGIFSVQIPRAQWPNGPLTALIPPGAPLSPTDMSIASQIPFIEVRYPAPTFSLPSTTTVLSPPPPRPLPGLNGPSESFQECTPQAEHQLPQTLLRGTSLPPPAQPAAPGLNVPAHENRAEPPPPITYQYLIECFGPFLGIFPCR